MPAVRIRSWSSAAIAPTAIRHSNADRDEICSTAIRKITRPRIAALVISLPQDELTALRR